MAKKIEDTRTIDMHGEPKRRGRPATGKAMTAAERKRVQRKRDAEAIWSTGTDITTLTTSALLDGIRECVTGGWAATAEKLAAELVRRASLKK